MRRRRGQVRPGRVLITLVLAPVLLFAWALASLGDILGLAVHLGTGSVATLFAVFATLIGEEPRARWRFVGDQVGRVRRDFLSAGSRLLRIFGWAGLPAGVREDARRARRGAHSESAPGPGIARSAPRRYPFEDRYRIESLLGSGGSTARLFIVRRVERGRPVGERRVLKYFDLAAGSRLAEAIRESRGMAVAKEMGIVLDHELAGDHFYYVMPYHEGETLTRAVARIHRRLAPSEGLPAGDRSTCLAWMGDLLRILDGYHRRGVIHKDVKPDNVIVTERGVRLVDLGLLTPLASALTLTTHGTEYFRDPEMVKLAVRGKRVREVDAARFDIYSAGAVLYYLFEGSFPACGPLSRFSRPVPLVISWIVSRAMAEGAKRYSSVAEMRRDLVAVTAEEDPGAMPARRLPSFAGGAEAGPPPPPVLMGSPRGRPRRGRTSLRFLGPVVLLLVVAGVLAGAPSHRSVSSSSGGSRAAGPGNDGPAVDPDPVVRCYSAWAAHVTDRRKGTDAAAVDPRHQALYVASDGSLAGRVAARRVGTGLREAGVTVIALPAGAVPRQGLQGHDPGPGEMRKWTKAAGSGPAPCALWIADGGYLPAKDRQRVRLLFYDYLGGEDRYEVTLTLPGRVASR